MRSPTLTQSNTFESFSFVNGYSVKRNTDTGRFFLFSKEGDGIFFKGRADFAYVYQPNKDGSIMIKIDRDAYAILEVSGKYMQISGAKSFRNIKRNIDGTTAVQFQDGLWSLFDKRGELIDVAGRKSFYGIWFYPDKIIITDSESGKRISVGKKFINQ